VHTTAAAALDACRIRTLSELLFALTAARTKI